MNVSGKTIEKIILALLFLLVIVFLGTELMPFSGRMFEFHDQTQPARIQQFTLNLQHLQLPPRMAPNFSFGMGYPVFNFYAPFTYWVTGIIHLLGFSVINSLKISLLLALLLSVLSSFLLFKKHFRFYPSILGATVYVSSLYLAVDIFIRGNLGEVWFIALLPLALYMLTVNSEQFRNRTFMLTILTLVAITSVHNILSLIFIPLTIIYSLLLKRKRENIVALLLAIFINAYFYLPLILESSLTYAKEVAESTNFRDHFLCIGQLWRADMWGYGGSIPGCIDGIPFKLGKPQVVFFLMGLASFIFTLIIRKEKNWKIPTFIAALTIVSLFFTTYSSQGIWEFFSPVASVIQFPWRLISFSLIGLAFFAAYFWEKITIPLEQVAIIFIIIVILFTHSKYFTKPQISTSVFEDKYLSEEYIEQTVAYNVAEYLPKTADYTHWRDYGTKIASGVEDYQPELIVATDQNNVQVDKDTPFYKLITVQGEKEVQPSIHYFPYWKIFLNNQQFQPQRYDKFGRPNIPLDPKIKSTIVIKYQQTLIEQLGNLLSIASILLLLFSSRKNVWNRLFKTKT